MLKKLELHWQILIALGLAVSLGVFFDEQTVTAGVHLSQVLGFVGDLFLRDLNMLVLPLILASIITGVAGVGQGQGMGRLGFLTNTYYLLSSLLAIFIGLGLVVLIQPGFVAGKPAREIIGLSADVSQVVQQVEGRDAGDVVGIFLRIVPENVVADAVSGEMLGVIVFSILFGFFTTQITEGPRLTVFQFFQEVYEIMLKMTDVVFFFAPLGVFGLVGRVALSTGLEAVLPLLSFCLTVVLALAIHAVLVILGLLHLVARVDPRRHARLIAPALRTAFSTASSSGTLALTMERMLLGGVSKRVASFTLPSGATVNMDGTALFECVAAVFIAQAYGIQLSFVQLLLVVLLALLTSIGVVRSPVASLVAISLILTSMGLPLEGLGMILAVDRVLDMCRTSVNVLSDTVGAVIVAKLEWGTDLLQDPPSAGPSHA
jgi:proton glutamate symport protein